MLRMTDEEFNTTFDTLRLALNGIMKLQNLFKMPQNESSKVMAQIMDCVLADKELTRDMESALVNIELITPMDMHKPMALAEELILKSMITLIRIKTQHEADEEPPLIIC